MWDASNIFLNGPYAPWREEGVAFDLEIEGQIPEGLDGALYRAGSNQHMRPENPARMHFFDGDGMVHAVFLRDGRATYRNAYVKTEGLKLELKAGKALFGSMINGSGKPPVMDGSLPPFKNPANTNVTPFDDRLLVFCEVGLPHELRPDTLETLGNYDFHSSVAGPVTAHFKVDPDNGDLLFYGASGNILTWYRANTKGEVLDTHKFDMGMPAFVHDYAVTPNYAIVAVTPQLFAIDQAILGRPGIIWDTDQMPVAKFAVMSRATGDVRWFDADTPFAISHFYNAYEDGQTIVVDAHRTVGADFGHRKETLATYGDDGDYNGWFTSVRSIGTRWELDLTSGKVKERAHTDVQGDYPKINDARTGLKNRFEYFVTMRGLNDWLIDGIGKIDHVTGNTEIITVDGRTAPCEPVFVPREGATAEDDGWLLSYWWDPTTDLSELIIHDAQDTTAAPVARVKINHRVPIGVHGNWVPGADLDSALSGRDEA